MTNKDYRAAPPGRYARGVSLLELLVVMSIIGILVKVAMPSMETFVADQRLVGAAEQLYGHLQQARTEAVSRNQTLYFNFSASGTTTWTYGMSTYTSSCDLTKTAATSTGACVMVTSDGDSTLDNGSGSTDTGDLVLYRFPSTDFTGVKMTLSSFSSGTQITYSPLRGTSTSGKITLESAKGTKLQVEVSLLGHPKICTPDSSMKAYPAC